jgi:ABC-2 type transport system ATP-binding protein
VIVTTSYLDEAERCDRVALLHHGRTLALGRPPALLREYPGRVVAVRPSDRTLRDRLRALPAVRQAYLFGESIHVRLDEGTGDPAVLLAPAGVRAGEMVAVTPSLEDLFLALTAEDAA